MHSELSTEKNIDGSVSKSKPGSSGTCCVTVFEAVLCIIHHFGAATSRPPQGYTRGSVGLCYLGLQLELDFQQSTCTRPLRRGRGGEMLGRLEGWRGDQAVKTPRKPHSTRQSGFTSFSVSVSKIEIGMDLTPTMLLSYYQ